MNQRSLDGFPRKVFSLLLSFGILSASLPASAGFWGRDDSDSYQRDNYRYNNQNNYQPAYKPPDIKIAAPKVDFKPVNQDFYKVPEGRLNDDDRQMIRAGNALNPPKVPDSYRNPAKNPALTAQVKPVTTPLTLQFKPADVKTSKAQEIKQNVLKDPSATAVKQPLIGGFQKVIQIIGNAIMAVGTKIVQAVQAVAHFFRGNPSTEPSALAKQVSQQYTHLNEIKPGVFRTTNEGQTYANGHSWEPGSTFKATPNGLQVIHGTAMEDSFGSLRRADGKTMPVIMNGNANGGVDPVGVDFARMTPGTSLKATSPVEIPKVGTIRADQITYSGQKNGDPILEVHGKGVLSVESISDPKIIRQATDQLSIRLRLMNDSFQVKDAVLTVGGERSYLDAQGKATPVSAIEKGVQAATDGAAPMLAGAKKLATADENNGRAADAQIKNIFSQTGHTPDGALAPTDEAARFKAAAEGFSRQASAAKADLAGVNYGEALAALPSLKEQGAALQAEQSRLTTKSEALRGFSKSLCGLSGDLRDLDNAKISHESLVEQTNLRVDVLADRSKRFFPAEKANVGTHTDAALNALGTLAETGQIDAKTAAGWRKTLGTVKTQLLGAVPEDGSILAAQEISEMAKHPQDEGSKAIGQSMDAVVFHPLEGASKNHPVATERIGTVGYWSSKAAVAGSEVFGVATMGYFAWAAPLVTGGSIAAGWGTKKALQAGGVNDDAAGFYGGVVGLLAADGLSSSKPVNVAEGKLTGFVGRLADKASGLLPGLRTAFEQTVAGEAGFVRSPIGKAEAATSGAAVETTAVTDMRVSGQVVAKTPDYYARPDGEVIPATGYRYLSRNSVYLDQVIKTGEVPSTPRGTYFSFDKIDNVVAAPTKLQTPHDASIRVEFDTKQILDDVQIPRGGWGNANHLEPITKDYPEFGSGGATQAFTRQPLKVRRVVDLRTGEVLYDAGQ